MRILRLVFSIAIIFLLFFLCHFKHGKLPPLGWFLDPSNGFWQNNVRLDKIPDSLRIPGLIEDVQVVYDERRVPHIFAKNDHDLYLAQGYVVAKERLWQMELQTHLAAGRLAEIVGKSALELDRYNRRIGLAYGAERAWESLKEKKARKIVEAYSDGINAFISQLHKKDYPLEYKILDYKPEKWTPFKSMLMLKLLSKTLSGFSDEPSMTTLREFLGEETMDELFPLRSPFLDPIIPVGTEWNMDIPKPEPPSPGKYPKTRSPGDIDEDQQSVGSNNWAIAGKRTKSKAPILCNDPHLELNLPSIWFEMQLSAPGVNVYGVTIPGTPAITIGFNENIAWGLTNAGTDVFDWYKITFKDEDREEYFYNGSWRKVISRMEKIFVRGANYVEDIVLYTHHGPVVYTPSESGLFDDCPPDSALRWVAHDPSHELLALLGLNRAQNYSDYVKALSFFYCPAQNFVFAAADGDIAIRHNGKFPLRWIKQGRYIADGSDPEFEWQGWIPMENIPQIKNPERGFVSSANQGPTDSSYPFYLDWSYAAFSRGARINELLAGQEDFTPLDMVKMQNDVLNLYAQKVLPVLLPLIERKDLTEQEKSAFSLMQEWDNLFSAEAIGPTVFQRWWRELSQLIWRDELSMDGSPLKLPNSDVTLHKILTDTSSPYFDINTTEKIESLKDLTIESFKTSVGQLSEMYGSLGPNWAWGKIRGTDIYHLAKIPGLNRLDLISPGNSGTVNAINRTFGPSWRMIVTWEPDVKGWGIYPGGQTGNPGSRFYDNMIDDWVAGKIYELRFLKNPNIEAGLFAGKMRMRGAK